MIGAFLALGTPSSLAILAVLSYRLISFWLPTVPRAAAYIQRRRTVGHWKDETNTASRQPGWDAAEPAFTRTAAGYTGGVSLSALAARDAGHPEGPPEGSLGEFRRYGVDGVVDPLRAARLAFVFVLR
jgi:hypothetical protein